MGIDETVTLTAERFDDLVEAEAFLERLYAAGVDNWEGYSEAFKEDDE
jgi:hypothetical protein